jgi:hypothetical protein
MKQAAFSRPVRLRQRHGAFAILLATTIFTSAPVHAQDASALINKLVEKGILTDQEGAEVRTDMAKQFSQSPAGKINLSNSVTQMNIYGDLRLRYQYNDLTPVLPNGAFPAIEQDRFRYRLRLNMDVYLGPSWFLGVQLQTQQNSDSGNQTYGTTFNNDNIFISRAFLGYRNDWMKIIAGKQPNPFYTTDLVWDPDINPSGLTENISLTRMPLFGGAAGPNGTDEKGVTAPLHQNPWDISLIAGQFILGDNSKFAGTGSLANDPWMFVQQLVTTYHFNKNTSITFAPGFLAENNARISGAINTLPFTDEGAVISGTTAITTTTMNSQVVTVTYSAKGVPTKTITPTTVTTTTQSQVTPNNFTSGPATVSGPRTSTSTSTATRNQPVITLVGKASGLPTNLALAGQSFTTTTTGQAQTVKTTNNVTLPAVTAETADLRILTAPGDITFSLGGLKTKIYWDFAYNTAGEDRYNYVYQMKEFGSKPYRIRDSIAWLAGLQVGEIKKRGDWQALFDYRETGLAAVDPNINDSEAANSSLNMRGFKFALAYAITDFVVLQGTGYLFWDLEPNLSGGRATSPGGIAPYKSYKEAILELNIKF